MKKLVRTLACILPTLGIVFALVPAPAVAAAPVVCEHIKIHYSYVYLEVAYPATVDPSQCSIGSVASTSVTGSGYYTAKAHTGAAPCNITVLNLEGCDHFNLTITIGSETVHPIFDSYVQSYFLVNNGYGTIGPIFNFNTGKGSGILSTVCAYNSVTGAEDCTATGSFVWRP